MANVRFALNAEADIASSDEVRTAVREGTDSILNRLPTRNRAYRRRIPRSYNLIAATGNFVLDFGGPASGFMWWLVEIIVTAQDHAAAPAGAVAAVYCGAVANQQSPTAISGRPTLGDLVRPAIALPAVFTFQRESFPVHDGEDLSVIIDSATTGLFIMSAVATVMELPDSAVMLNRT